MVSVKLLPLPVMAQVQLLPLSPHSPVVCASAILAVAQQQSSNAKIFFMLFELICKLFNLWKVNTRVNVSIFE